MHTSAKYEENIREGSGKRFYKLSNSNIMPQLINKVAYQN